jgi:hypothetical protein
VDTEVDQRACQDVICGESAVAEGRTVLFRDLIVKQNERIEVGLSVGGNLHEAKKVETGMILQAAPEGGTILQAAPDGKLLEPLKASNSGIASCVEASTGKYEIHLNVSNLSGCYFNFGPGSNSSAFPVAKTG